MAIELGTAWLVATQYLALAKGKPSGDRCVEAQIDDHWWVAFNRHAHLCFTSDRDMLVGLAIFVKRDGRFIGILDPGGTCSFPEENEFIADVRAAMPQ